MGTRQVKTPNIDIPAERGWCLKYVDDGVAALARQARAIYSYNVEKRNGNIRTGNIPVGVWLPGYLTFSKGAYVDYGHVFWIYKHGDGSVEIHDSEVHAGARGAYHSLAELIAWFGAYKPVYLGYSLWLDGVQVAEEFADPVPAPEPQPDQPTPTDGYTVKDGDTLGQIIVDQGWATDAGLWGPGGDVERIAAKNGIKNPDLIHPGDVITNS